MEMRPGDCLLKCRGLLILVRPVPLGDSAVLRGPSFRSSGSYSPSEGGLESGGQSGRMNKCPPHPPPCSRVYVCICVYICSIYVCICYGLNHLIKWMVESKHLVYNRCKYWSLMLMRAYPSPITGVTYHFTDRREQEEVTSLSAYMAVFGIVCTDSIRHQSIFQY